MKDNYAILINTTDSFDDCWEPFFKLFKKYWPEFNGKIYLNTETKEFKYSGINIISIKNGLLNKPWSTCLHYAINQIEEDYFIYMQEDYFLHKNVNNEELEKLFSLFKNNKLDCLHLTDQCTHGPFNTNTFNENIWEVNKGAKYRVSTQAAFWKKSSILNIIRPWESGWDFEKFASIRSSRTTYRFMCVNQELYQKDFNEILPYIFTGIIKGSWKEEVEPLFNLHNIKINFKERGFVTTRKSTSKIDSIINIIYKFFKNFFLEKVFFFKNKFYNPPNEAS